MLRIQPFAVEVDVRIVLAMSQWPCWQSRSGTGLTIARSILPTVSRQLTPVSVATKCYVHINTKTIISRGLRPNDAILVNYLLILSEPRNFTIFSTFSVRAPANKFTATATTSACAHTHQNDGSPTRNKQCFPGSEILNNLYFKRSSRRQAVGDRDSGLKASGFKLM
ncbi:uncharacterized protein ARMOST_02287 [Armillaria ostoyae]|uniref:Uncharacterized protein n=1 Tax=Armillaria ostoyae TaxID=47428 RepID=A0A284QRB3_ARMOS|nr:uncharacterized protein ARMOST_02287 [Armillaria ostoyae]